MHALGRLITDQMKNNGWSLDAIVTRMEHAGHPLSKSQLGDIRNSPVKSLTKRSLFAVAYGIGVTPLTVANAALESMGINPHPIAVTDSIETIKIDPTLSERDRDQVVAMVDFLRASADARRNAAARIAAIANNEEQSADKGQLGRLGDNIFPGPDKPSKGAVGDLG